MSKITLNDITNLQNETSVVTNINANNSILEAAVDNTLSRDGSNPNHMLAGIDMNSHQIINLPSPMSALEPLRLQDLVDFIGGSLVVTVPNAPTVYVSAYTAGGTSDDTAGVQLALDAANTIGGATVVFDTRATYTVDQVNLYSNTTLDGNGCLIVQRTVDVAQFRGANRTNVTFKNFRYRGSVYPTTFNYSAPRNSNNTFIRLDSCTNVRITNNIFEYCAYHCIRLLDCYDYEISGNFIRYCAGGILLTGTRRGVVTNNRLIDTCLYSLTPTFNQFTTVIQLESTDQNGTLSPLNEINRNVIISNNIIRNYPYAQGIFMHAGYSIVVSGNVVENVSAPISINPYNTVDYISWVTITNNVIRGTEATALPPSFDADAGITVVGGPTGGAVTPSGNTPIIDSVVISGNVVQGCNRCVMNTSSGGVLIGYTKNCTVTGNSVSDNGHNAIVTSSSEDGITMTGNNLSNSNGQSYGLYMLGSLRGLVVANAFNTLSVGQKQTVGVASLTRANNGYYTVTTNEA